MIGTDAWVQVVTTLEPRGGIEHAQVTRAAALTAELAAQSEKEVSEVCSHPPGLHDEPAKTDNVTSPVTNCPFSLAASSSLAASDSSLPADSGFFKHAGGFRGAQPRTATRAQEVAAMLDETLGFYVKATGKDESLMRGQFTSMKLESLRKERDRWTTRAEAKQRLQDKKEEAWELFQRQARLGVARREESSSGSTCRKRKSTHLSVIPVQMKSLCKRGWKICSKSLWHKTERRKPERSRAWGKRIPTHRDVEHGRGLGSASPRLVAVSCSWKLSRDVGLYVELAALVSSVETTLCSNSI